MDMDRDADAGTHLEKTPTVPTSDSSKKPTTCFICSSDIDTSFSSETVDVNVSQNSSTSASVRVHSTDKSDNWTWTTAEAQGVARCLNQLFDIHEEEEESQDSRLVEFIHETYCTKCRELLDTILVIYEQLDKLNRELEENKRKVHEHLRESYSKNLETRESATASESELAGRLRLQQILLTASQVANKSRLRVPDHPADSLSRPIDPDFQDQDQSPQPNNDFPEGYCATDHSELIEIKVEPIDHAFGYPPVGNVDYQNEPEAQDEIDLPELPDYSDEEELQDAYEDEHDTRKLQRMTSAHVKLERNPSLRTRLKKKNYDKFFQDSEPDDEDADEQDSDQNDGLMEYGQAHEDPDNEPRRTGSKKRRHEKLFLCKYCGKNCYCESKLERHESGHSDAKRFNCEVCEKPFKTRFAAENHKATHIVPEGPVEKPYHCDLCPNEYLSDRGLRKHLATFHKGKGRSKRVRLPKKKKVPKSKSKADTNSSPKSNATKDLECKLCGKMCKSGYDLSYHLDSHKPDHERRHVCDECGRGFFKASILARHKAGQHTNRSGPVSALSLCPICGKYVTTLKTHIRSHTGEKLFPCSICKKSFGTSESARVHARIHTGEKPYECATCGMKFRTAQAHRRHATVHLDQKSHICDHCGKAFRLRQSLREHFHIHTKEAPHRCSICGRRFASTTLLSQHMSADHTAEQIERKKLGSRRRKDEAEYFPDSEVHRTSLTMGQGPGSSGSSLVSESHSHALQSLYGSTSHS